MNRNGLWMSGLVAAALIASVGSHAQQSSFALTSLTVPEKNLPANCRMRPYVAPTTPASQVGGQTVITLKRESSFSYPANPWIGADRQYLLMLRGQPAMPDAPPPSAAERGALESRWLQHIREGYRALYDAPDGMVVEVRAIKFDDPQRIIDAASLDGPVLSGGPGLDTFSIGAISVRVSSSGTSDCYRAIDTHVRALK